MCEKEEKMTAMRKSHNQKSDVLLIRVSREPPVFCENPPFFRGKTLTGRVATVNHRACGASRDALRVRTLHNRDTA